MGARDYGRLLALVHDLNRCRRRVEVGETIARGVSGIVGADHVSWDDLALSVPAATVVEAPRLPELERRRRVFAERMSEHPCLRHWQRTGDMRPCALSDFLSKAELERLPLYRHLFAEMGYADQLGMCLTAPRQTTQAVAVGRSRPGFTRDEREMLAALRPHAAAAYANARAIECARAAEGALGVAVVSVSMGGRILDCSATAERWLRQYFGGKFEARELPGALRSWLRAAARRRSADEAPLVPRLVKARDKRRLIVRLSESTATEASLILEETSTPEAAAHLRACGLTAREVEVLLEVERGRSNPEIAAALCISTRTVVKHLEKIYRKLGVHSRTAAVARLRGTH